MGIIQIIVLAVLQGLTEFLPISSSAHLILVPQLVDWPDQGLAFDVAVHVGTLSAVVFYFRHELAVMTRDWLASLRRRRLVGESRLAWAVLFGTIPVGLAGLLLHDPIGELGRSVQLIAVTTIGFGLLLWAADAWGRRVRDEHHLRWSDVLVIGLAQALALVPGTSRSGITITAGLLLGLSRQAAARFSFLLAIPVIVLAGGLETVELVRTPGPVQWTALWLGALISAVTAYACIALFLRLLERIGMLPFVLYRLLLGAVLFWWIA